MFRMGYSPGDYIDMDGVKRHIEQKDHCVRIYWQADEMGPRIDLTAYEARTLANHLLLCAHMMDGQGTDV